MDSSNYKLYHVHGFDSRICLEDYFSNKPEMVIGDDSLKFPIEHLTKIFTQGIVKGNTLIDISVGPLVHHLYSACEIFKDIIILKVSDRCIMELKRWVDSRTGAFNWEHVTKLHGEIGGSSDQSQDKELKVKSAIPHVVKCDFEKENITAPIVLPPADCIISAWLLGIISKDQDDYIRYFRKFSGLLKPGGHLIIFGCLGTTYYVVGKDKFHVFSYDEDFLKKCLVGEGFVIDYCQIQKRTAENDIVDYKSVICIAAHKET